MPVHLTLESLLPLVGSSFTSHTSHGPRALQLYSVETLDRRGLPQNFAAPLSLIFSGSREVLMAQDNYLLDHAKLGTVQLFMVPVMAPATVSHEQNEAQANYYQVLLS